LHGMQEVSGSIPLGSTNFRPITVSRKLQSDALSARRRIESEPETL
jgi:hypothetical protein